MQKFDPVDSLAINYSNSQQSIENAVTFGSEMNNSTSDEAILDSASYQTDSNSAFFSNCSNANSVDFNHMQANFTYNDKYSNNYVNQIVDEISQTSLTSTCSSQLDDSMTSRQQSMIKINSLQLNQLKSVPEEDSTGYQNSPLTKPQVFSSPTSAGKAKKNEGIEKLYSMSNEPDRRPFLEKLLKFNSEAGITMLVCPTIAKNLIDLYRVYNMVKERGGFVEVCRNIMWKEIAENCGFPITSTTAYSLRKKYTKFILPYECKFDRDDVDPESIILQTTDIKNKRGNRNNKKQQTSSPTNSMNNNSQQDIQMNYLPQQTLKGTNNNLQTQFNNQPNYNNKQLPPNQISVKPMQYTNQIVFNNGYEQQQIQIQKNVYLDDQQYINQMPQEQMMNYDPNLYSSNNQQIIINQDYNNQQYYNQYESDYHNSTNQLHKSASVATGQPQYYSDPNQYNNVINYTYDQMQYSNYNITAGNHSQDINLYTDSSRMPTTNTVNSRTTMSSEHQQQQFSSSKQYQFTTNTNAYDYAQPQPNSRTSQTNYSNIAYQNSSSRVQQPYIVENVNLTDAKQQYNQIENWQTVNSAPSSNWPNQNCYPAQISISSQQQQPIESPIQTKTFSNNNSNLIHTRSQPVHQTLPAVPIKQQNSYYSNNLSSTNKSLALQPNSNHLLPMQQQNNQPNAFNSNSFNQMHHQPQSNLFTSKNFLGRDIDFPPDCVESVQPDLVSKRKLTVKDLQNYDISKLMMSLKSGLLGESTQALNTLSIIVGDDSTYNNIKLTKHSGFLKLLLKYFRSYLNELFPDIFSSEVLNDDQNNIDEFDMNNNEIQKETINQNNFDQNNQIEQAIICNGIDNPKLFDEQQALKFIHYTSINHAVEFNLTKIKDDRFILTSLHPKRKTPERKNDDEKISCDELKPKTKHFKRNFLDDYENEAKVIEVDPFCTISEFKEDNNQRCICVSTIIRNLSFVHGNEQELSNDRDLMFIISKILLYSHKHNEKKVRNLNEFDNCQEQKIEQNKETWWFEALNIIQENALVTLTNMAASLNFNEYQEELSLPILEGLLHWALCPSSAALDNFTSTSIKSCSPKRLALECLSKLSILEPNVDLLLATPPLSHNSKAFTSLTNLLSKCEQQIIREFALVILSNFVMADQSIATAICCSTDIVQQLICYLEQYRDNLEHQQLKEYQTHLNQSNTTTLDMAKRAATCLNHLAKVPENNQYFFIHQEQLMQLATSGVLDQSLSKMISEVIFEYSSYEALANQQAELESTNDLNLILQQTNTLPDTI